jgi:hypothetical protein
MRLCGFWSGFANVSQVTALEHQLDQQGGLVLANLIIRRRLVVQWRMSIGQANGKDGDPEGSPNTI